VQRGYGITESAPSVKRAHFTKSRGSFCRFQSLRLDGRCLYPRQTLGHDPTNPQREPAKKFYATQMPRVESTIGPQKLGETQRLKESDSVGQKKKNELLNNLAQGPN
jgi:hypothetical protein